MKKKLLVCALLTCCLALMAYGTVAYFTSQDTATNVITAGNIKIELKEMAVQSDGGELIPFEDQTGVMPGAQISKIVTVVNTGSNEAYIRVAVEKAIELAGDAEGDADLSLVTMDMNKEHWTEKDGYYYYNEPLEAGAETKPLFTTVSFTKEMDNLYQGSTAKIDVNAQATQAANNGDSVFDAAGWPEK